MRVISRKRLRDFWAIHPDAAAVLQEWFRVARHAKWTRFTEVRATYNSADQVEQFTVFDLGGNKYRLIAVLNFPGGVLYIRAVLTHAEYARGKWKKDEFGKRGEWRGERPPNASEEGPSKRKPTKKG